MSRLTAGALVLVVSSAAGAAPASPPAVAALKVAPAATSSTAGPAPSSNAGKGALLMGEAALKAGLAPKCIELSKEALKSGQLDVNDTAAAWLLRGRCHALDGDADRAERSYAVATRLKPTLTLGSADTIWQRVQPEGAAPNTSLQLLAAAVVVDGGQPAIEVTTQDDLLLGHTIVVTDAAGKEIARAPVEPAVTTTPPPVKAMRHRFMVESVAGTITVLLDRNGNVLRTAAVQLQTAEPTTTATTTTTTTAPSEPAAATTLPLAPGVVTTIAREPGVLAYVGGGAAFVGFATAAVCGIQWAEQGRLDPDNTNDAEFPFVAGTIAGAVVMAVGAGLIVVERL